ncbi:MAG: hypothetical protein R3F49_19595 [Planctomycetota bacterium]
MSAAEHPPSPAWAASFRALPSVRLTGEALVISDLHLPPNAGAATDMFVAWCAEIARDLRAGQGPNRRVTRFVCLGDLFDVWVGRCQLELSGTGPVAEALRALGALGVACDLVPGNRDSLLDEAFAARAGVALWPDGFVLVAANGARVLCLHGDDLCVRERGYLRLRRVMRSRAMRALSRVAPLWFARRVGRGLRQRYSGALRPASDTRGPQRDAALAAAQAARAEVLLSGHSHAPSDLELRAGGRGPGAGGAARKDPADIALGEPAPSVRWVTLGAFGDAADLVHLGADGAATVRDSAPRR